MVEPSKELQLVFEKSLKDAKKLQHEYMTLEHLLFAMLCSENFFNLLKGFGADTEYFKE
jgi:ATP-dependent Clp protease ATP-binding subunit ClpA